MARPLALAFPGDRAAAAIDDQYLLGPALLVTPIFSESLEPIRRAVRLPTGDWLDWWTGEIVPGGRYVERDYPLDHLPLGPVMRHVDERPAAPLVVRVAPAGDGALDLPEAERAW